jgi:two-component system phosphate regulon response regulator OmpR
MTAAHILVVDDDDDIRLLLREFLSSNSYLVSTACNVAEARLLLKEFEFDLIVMDIMMPEETGIEFLSSAREPLPVILLSALSDVNDRIDGLKSGAEDYLSKPFDPRELLIRIEKVLSRIAKSSNEVIFGNYSFDMNSNCLLAGEKVLSLTEAELAVFKKLARNFNKPVNREVLALAGDGINLRSIDTTINRIRSKIEVNPKQPKYLISIRGIGYLLKG